MSLRRCKPNVACLLVLISAILLAGPAHAQSFNVLYNFDGVIASVPEAGVSIDRGGNLYGTTISQSLGSGGGTVYRLSNRNGAWHFSKLLGFSSHGPGGDQPLSRPVLSPGGIPFGTTNIGGYSGDPSCEFFGCGVVYELRPPANQCPTVFCFWTESLPHVFGADNPSDGVSPGSGDLLFDLAGNIYGTTVVSLATGQGAIYELSPSGGGWTESVLYTFVGYINGATDGVHPLSGVIMDSGGDLFGTTKNGGSNRSCDFGDGCGTVYQLSPSGSGWTEHVLYSFQAGDDGYDPTGGLVMDAAGNLFGTTSLGGANGGGTVFELSPSGGGWVLTTLYSFPQTSAGFAGCMGPNGSLLRDSSGALYGNICANGALGYGAVFKLSNVGGVWTYSSLHDFTNGSDGSYPFGALARDANGNLFGTAAAGGTQSSGTVWAITP